MSGIKFSTERRLTQTSMGDQHVIKLWAPEAYCGEWGFGKADADAFEAMVDSHEACVAALGATLPQAYGCWANHYGDNPEGSSEPEHIEMIRAALALARRTIGGDV